MKYLGGGYIHGVPARDLTDEEAKRFADEIRSAEKATGMKLYEADKPKRTATAQKGGE